MTGDSPGPIPVTIPVAAATVATVVSPLLQAPPVIDPVNVLVVPVHIPVAPEMAGAGLTLIIFVAVQPPME